MFDPVALPLFLRFGAEALNLAAVDFIGPDNVDPGAAVVRFRSGAEPVRYSGPAAAALLAFAAACPEGAPPAPPDPATPATTPATSAGGPQFRGAFDPR